ncbi:MAG: hypothetical protein KDK39_04140 [Leptospiraceae bacterium]|nr:hypothetical protein [Leptospiraceae bacterium]
MRQFLYNNVYYVVFLRSVMLAVILLTAAACEKMSTAAVRNYTNESCQQAIARQIASDLAQDYQLKATVATNGLEAILKNMLKGQSDVLTYSISEAGTDYKLGYVFSGSESDCRMVLVSRERVKGTANSKTKNTVSGIRKQQVPCECVPVEKE